MIKRCHTVSHTISARAITCRDSRRAQTLSQRVELPHTYSITTTKTDKIEQPTFCPVLGKVAPSPALRTSF